MMFGKGIICESGEILHSPLTEEVGASDHRRDARGSHYG